MAGHVFPVWLRFKGGKGVAVGAGALIALMPLAAAILVGVWAVIVVATRYTSVASMTAAVLAVPVAWALGYPWSSIVFVAVGAGGRAGPPPRQPDAAGARPGAADRPLESPPGLSPGEDRQIRRGFAGPV